MLAKVLESIEGAAFIAVCLIFRFALRPWYSH